MSNITAKGDDIVSEIDTLRNIYKDKIKLKPKEQWICDNCGEVIETVNDGWLEWYIENARKDMSEWLETGFRIVHNVRCIYNSTELFNEGKSVSDMHLDSFVGEDGIAYLLTLFEKNRLKDLNELTEIIRRLHLSYYEESRQYWHIAEMDGFFDGANEVSPFLTRTLLEIIGRYSE